MSIPCTIIIFGATGDLTKRKLIPALYKLDAQGRLHQDTRIIAIGRRPYDDHQMREELKDHLKDTTNWGRFSQRITYHLLEFHDAAAYDTLKGKLAGAKNKVFYLATAPESFPLIIKHLHRTGIASKKPTDEWQRVVFEKPFGSDLKTARILNKTITALFQEQQIYRIDHYLGKELVQDLLVLRFANPIFEELWNGNHVDSVEVVVLEKSGVGTRGGYYETAGALRDMVQSHLLQVVSLVAMNDPKTLHADDIRNEKVKALRSIKIESPAVVRKNLILGQYTAGTIEGKQAPGYRDETGVSKSSTTETFAAVKLSLNGKRWKGVPFYVRTGKALLHGYAEVVISFKQMPCKLFRGADGKLSSNKLIVRIQPDEGMKLQFNLKEEGGDYNVLPYTMDFSHQAEFGMNTPEAYERLITDVIRGDQTLFTRWDEVEQAWKIVDNLRKAKAPLRHYAAGTHGPKEALTLVKHDGRDWSGDQKVKSFEMR